MKIPIISLVLALAGVEVGSATAQTTTARVIERGANYKIVQTVRPAPNGFGLVTNGYTALQNGMNYQDTGGNWVESQPVVGIFPSGVVCAGASYQVILGTNLNMAGAVDLLTSDRKEIVSRPAGIAFFDPVSGRRALLAQVKDCPPELLSSNEIAYPDAFEGNGIRAAVVYKYETGRFSQDVKFLKPLPVTPADFGMGSRTRLEILTEIEQCPTPAITNHVLASEANPVLRAQMAEPDLVDETLDWGEMRMPLGHAYPEDQPAARPGPPRGVPVAKQLETIGGLTLLVEAIPWGAVTNQLAKLPQQSARVNRPGPPAALELAWAKSHSVAAPFASRLAQITGSRPILLAFAARNSQVSTLTANGFVMDYTIVQSDTDVTFDSGETYLVEGSVYLDGTTTFNPNAIIKYAAAFDTIWIEGSVSYFSFGGSPVILTSMNDDRVGDVITNSTGHPERGPTAGWELALEYLDADTFLGPLDFRYAYGGIEVDASAGRSVAVYSASFTDIYQGVQAGQVKALTVSSAHVCFPDYPSGGTDLYEQSYPGTVSIGTITTCTNDFDSDGLPDAWEYKYFGNLNQTASGDSSGDGISNLQKWQLGLNPLLNNPAQSGERANYGYTPADWLNGVSGARSGTVNPDNEGNVQTVSQ